METTTAIGYLIILVYLGLCLAWVIVENRRDWFLGTRRATRYVALGMAVIGTISVAIHVFGSRFHPDFFWWSTPLLAFMSSFILGIIKPSVGINTAYRFMTVTAPAAICLACGFFLFLFAAQAGGCLIGFRLGEAISRLFRGTPHSALRIPHFAVLL